MENTSTDTQILVNKTTFKVRNGDRNIELQNISIKKLN